MWKRGIAVSLVLGLASVAQGGAVVELKPSCSSNPYNPLGYYDAAEVVTVEVFVGQTGGTDHLIRLVRLNMDETDGNLAIGPVDWVTDDASHYEDGDLAGGPDGVATAYYYEEDTNLGPNPVAQLTLPGDGEVKVAEFSVTMPVTEGDYMLDVVVAASAVAFGFDCDPTSTVCDRFAMDGDVPVTIWYGGVDLTGGELMLHMIDQALTSATPVDQKSLSRVQMNIAKLTFDTDLGAMGPVALAGQIEIVELLAGGVLGGDLSASFTFEIADDGGGNPRLLKVKDTGANMSEAWYAIRNVGWAVVPAFEVQYRVLPGDIDGNGFVLSNDVAAVNAAFGPCPTGDCPEDLDGNNFVLSNDVAAANANFGPGPVKPSGHDCD